MLYERKLRENPIGWGMHNQEHSFDMFFYQEAESEDLNPHNPGRVYCFAF